MIIFCVLNVLMCSGFIQSLGFQLVHIYIYMYICDSQKENKNKINFQFLLK